MNEIAPITFRFFSSLYVYMCACVCVCEAHMVNEIHELYFAKLCLYQIYSISFVMHLQHFEPALRQWSDVQRQKKQQQRIRAKISSEHIYRSI